MYTDQLHVTTDNINIVSDVTKQPMELLLAFDCSKTIPTEVIRNQQATLNLQIIQGQFMELVDYSVLGKGTTLQLQILPIQIQKTTSSSIQHIFGLQLGNHVAYNRAPFQRNLTNRNVKWIELLLVIRFFLKQGYRIHILISGTLHITHVLIVITLRFGKYTFDENFKG